MNNCEVSTSPHGFRVRVDVNGEEVGVIQERQAAFRIKGLKQGNADLKFTLIDPSGEECSVPQYSNEPQSFTVQ